MNRLQSFLFVACVLPVELLPGALSAGEQPTRLEIVEMPAVTMPLDAPVIPWVLPDDKSWSQGKPVFDVADTQSEYKATGWMAVTKEHILFHFVVKTEKFENTQQGEGLWNGDAIQMGIDALGRGSDTIRTPFDIDLELEKEFGQKTRDAYIAEQQNKLHVDKWKPYHQWDDEEKRLKRFNDNIENGLVMLPEDADFCFALGNNVPQAWSYYHARPGAAGDKSYLKPSIIRDENAKTTTYNLAIPWKEFGVEAGISPTMKLSLQFNCGTGKEQHRLYWGKGVGGRFAPWRFKTVVLGSPPAVVAASDVTRDEVMTAEDCAEVSFAVTTDRDYKIATDYEGNPKTLEIPIQPGATALKRYMVRAYPGKLPAGSQALKAALLSADGKVLAERSVAVRDGSMAQWYPWSPAGDDGPSVIGMQDWLDKPAGKHGTLHIKNDAFVFDDGSPVKFWGTLGSGPAIPDKTESDVRSVHFSKYGINLNRLFSLKGVKPEKKASCTQITDALWQDFDYYHAALKSQGVYQHFAPVWGLSVLPGDKSRVLAYDELAGKTGGSMGGLVNFATDLQDLAIELFVNILQHKNPHTGLTYAEDPALAIFEIQNEDDIFCANGAVLACPTYKKNLCEQFSDWLRAKYGSSENLAMAWGPRALNAFPAFQKDESLEARNIFPVMHFWWYTPGGLEDQERKLGVKVRLLDSAQFLQETQNKYYSRVEKALRATGYKGVIIGSNWIAGEGIGHYYNLLSDRLVGHIDRHNYWGGIASHYMGTGYMKLGSSMLWKPGSCLLSSGMEQVEDRSFGLSECMSCPPNEWLAEAPALIGAYGMGLQGWDAVAWCCYDRVRFTPSLAPSIIYNIGIPPCIGQFPSVARMVHRGDIRQGEVVSRRTVSTSDLNDGKLMFKDQVPALADVKEYGGAPLEALAAGRAVVDFAEKSQPPYLADLNRYIKEKVITSNTGQLVWDYSGAEQNQAYFTVNSDGTKAVVGFLPKKEFALGDVKITVDNKFAVVFVTSLEKDKTLTNCKSVIVTAIARSRNTGMRYNKSGSIVEEVGVAPIVLEPVFATVVLPRAKSVNVLDHDGRRTGKNIPVVNGQLTINGVADKTIYYEIVCE